MEDVRYGQIILVSLEVLTSSYLLVMKCLLQMLFVKKFALLWVHLICLSIAIYLRPEKNQSLLEGIKSDTGNPTNSAITR